MTGVEENTAEKSAGAEQPAEAKTQLLRVEERYIQLLEEKIKRLELEVAHGRLASENDASKNPSSSKSDSGEKTQDEEKGTEKDKKQGLKESEDIESKEDKEKTEEKEKDKIEEKEKEKSEEKEKEKTEEKEKARNSKVRYVHRKETAFGHDEEEVDQWDSTKSLEAEAEDVPTITWRRTQPVNDSGDVKQELIIESKILKNALSDVLGKTDEMTFDTTEVAIQAPYAILYHNEHKLREYAEDEANATAKPEIDILLAALQQEQKSLRKDIEAYKNNRTITFDLLWALFYPGCRVVQKIMGEPQQFVVSHLLHFENDEDRWHMFVAGIDYNGEAFLPVGRTVSVKQFSGSKPISELTVYPTEYWRDPKDDSVDSSVLVERLQKRGKIFENLCLAKLEKRHRQYTGVAITAGSIEMARDEDRDDGTVHTDAEKDESAGQKMILDDFVMIDHYAYLNLWKIGPTDNLMIGKEEVTWLDLYAKPWQQRWRHYIGELPQLDDGKLQGRLSVDQLTFCPPRVLGFAVSQKKFVQLLVGNVRNNISQKDKEKPWEDFKLKGKDKETLRNLVTQHAKSEVIEDVIRGKGKGLVVLLHGPPGVGKTLSAESLAILTDKPLYSVSMADIGLSPRTVESNLRRIFELATHWKAILLFDEADVFLEARSLEDVRRNSLVSTLLRILEYFQGILFLTSNRAKTFDEAFTSRIHMAIQFVPLDENQREEIWRMWFIRAKDAIDPSFDWEDNLDEDGTGGLVKHKLNGREIRNIVRSAINLALADEKSKGKLTWRHVNNVLQRTLDFKGYMLQGEEMAKRDNIR